MPPSQEADDEHVALDGFAPQELDAIYRIEAPRLLRVLKRRIWAEDERCDLVQEAFARLAGSKSDAARRNPGAYLHGIVRHLMADRVRKWARSATLTPHDLPTGNEPVAPDKALEIEELRALYRAAVHALPPRTREVYLLHRSEELSYIMIAERCGISVRTVEWHIAEAIVRISKSMNADG
jgi:RNA polymerase sigma factor (sigma-70 family)